MYRINYLLLPIWQFLHLYIHNLRYKKNLVVCPAQVSKANCLDKQHLLGQNPRAIYVSGARRICSFIYRNSRCGEDLAQLTKVDLMCDYQYT